MTLERLNLLIQRVVDTRLLSEGLESDEYQVIEDALKEYRENHIDKEEK